MFPVPVAVDLAMDRRMDRHRARGQMSSGPSPRPLHRRPTPGTAISGEVKEDETGWHEVRLSIPIHGTEGYGTFQIISRATNRTLEVWVAASVCDVPLRLHRWLGVWFHLNDYYPRFPPFVCLTSKAFVDSFLVIDSKRSKMTSSLTFAGFGSNCVDECGAGSSP